MTLFNLETLDSLLEYNSNFATNVYQKDKVFPNCILGYTSDNKNKLCFPFTFRNNNEKISFFDAVKLCFLAYNVDKYVVITESWFVATRDKSEFQKHPDLMKHPKRLEGLIIMAVNKLGNRMKILQITEEKTLIPWQDIPANNTEAKGNLLDLLPKEKLSDKTRERLMSTLKEQLNIEVTEVDEIT